MNTRISGPRRQGIMLGVVIGVLLLVGCAAPATAEMMIPAKFEVSHRIPHSVRVVTDGGEETIPTRIPRVSNEEFLKAIRTSIRKAGLFSSVESVDAAYQLTVTLKRVREPDCGMSMEASVVAKWELCEAKAGETILETYVETSSGAGAGDSWIGVKRARIALERAARANVKEGIRRLSLVDLETTK